MKFTSFFMDIRFQFRHGLYYAYGLISLIYIVVLHALPSGWTEQATIFILFSDCSFLGAFFVGGIILLEKDQGIYHPLFITPINVHEYLLGKVFSLSFLSLLSSYAILLFTSGVHFNFLEMFIGIVFNAMFATLLGIFFAVRVKSINQYLMLSPLFVTVFFLPILEFFQVYDSKWFYLIPGKAGLLLMQGAFIDIRFFDSVYALLFLIGAVLVMYYAAYRSFHKYVILNIGG